MTLETDCASAIEPPTEAKMPARQPQKRGVACYWLPSGKCMISPAGQQQKRGVACYWLPSGKCMISPPTGMAGEAGMGGVDVCENNDR